MGTNTDKLQFYANRAIAAKQMSIDGRLLRINGCVVKQGGSFSPVFCLLLRRYFTTSLMKITGAVLV